MTTDDIPEADVWLRPCAGCRQSVALCYCGENACLGWKHAGELIGEHGEPHLARVEMKNPIPCPGCPLYLDESERLLQIHHMETRHPDICDEREENFRRFRGWERED